MFNNPTFNLEHHKLMFKKPVTKTYNTATPYKKNVQHYRFKLSK
jgi:hypothetical protein